MRLPKQNRDQVASIFRKMRHYVKSGGMNLRHDTLVDSVPLPNGGIPEPRYEPAASYSPHEVYEFPVADEQTPDFHTPLDAARPGAEPRAEREQSSFEEMNFDETARQEINDAVNDVSAPRELIEQHGVEMMDGYIDRQDSSDSAAMALQMPDDGGFAQLDEQASPALEGIVQESAPEEQMVDPMTAMEDPMDMMR